MYSIAYAILKDENQAEDIVQDSFIKLSECLDKIKKTECLETRALVMKIVKNTAINRYRKNQKESWLFTFKEEPEMTDPSDLIEQKLMSIYQTDVLYQAAKDMPDIYKELIRLRFYYELSYQEIAEITDVDCATVRKRCERAKKYLYDRIVTTADVEGGLVYEKRQKKCSVQIR